MLRTLTRIIDYIGYLFGGTDLHGIHSPFIYALSEFSLYHKGDKRIESIEFQRTQMLKSKGFLLGHSLPDFVDRFTLPAKHCFALSRLVEFLNIRIISEYGKTTGIETNYALFAPLIKAKQSVTYKYEFSDENKLKISTNEQWLQNYAVEMSQINWNKSESENPWELHIVHLTEDADLIWSFWEQKQHTFKNHTIVIFTNIRYSDDHFLKWKQITHESNVSVDIDLFRMGILFFRKEQPKESFLLRY